MVDEQSGTIFDYRKLANRSPAILLPVIVPEGESGVERGVLWNKAELAEKMVNSTIAREMIAALPNELDADAQARIVESVGKFIARQHGVAVDVAIHRDAGNNHAHVLWTTRRFVGGELTAKTRELDLKASASKSLLAIRKHWEHECNIELETSHDHVATPRGTVQAARLSGEEAWVKKFPVPPKRALTEGERKCSTDL